MPKARRAFTEGLKREAVNLVQQPAAPDKHIATGLGIDQSVLQRWVGQERGCAMDIRTQPPLRSDSASEVEGRKESGW